MSDRWEEDRLERTSSGSERGSEVKLDSKGPTEGVFSCYCFADGFPSLEQTVTSCMKEMRATRETWGIVSRDCSELANN